MTIYQSLLLLPFYWLIDLDIYYNSLIIYISFYYAEPQVSILKAGGHTSNEKD